MLARQRSNPCSNMNHRRRDAPVSHCPQCGEVVNAAIASRRCTEEAHATARRQQSTFCVHCGTRLVTRR
jgi:hypothetical protein